MLYLGHNPVQCKFDTSDWSSDMGRRAKKHHSENLKVVRVYMYVCVYVKTLKMGKDIRIIEIYKYYIAHTY